MEEYFDYQSIKSKKKNMQRNKHVGAFSIYSNKDKHWPKSNR